MIAVFETIAVYPLPCLIGSIAALAGIIVSQMSPMGRAMMVFAFLNAPIAPLLAIRCGCHLTIALIDWLTVDRPWTALRSTDHSI